MSAGMEPDIERVLAGIDAGSVEKFTALSPVARAYLIAVLEAAGTASQASLESLYAVDYERRPVDPLTFLRHTDYVAHAAMPTADSPGLFPAWWPHFVRACSPLASIYELILTGASSLGKGHPVSARVLTPTGWRTVGDLKPGDAIIGKDGKAHRVCALYDRGVLDVFRVSFSDGASVVVDGDHLWAVRTSSQKRRGSDYKPLATRTLAANGLYANGSRKWFIPVVAPVEFTGGPPLGLDPYVLGVILGDGNLTNTSVVVTNSDPELRALVAPRLPSDVRCVEVNEDALIGFRLSRERCGSNGVIDALRSYGLWGSDAFSKFVPDAFLYASSEARLALLRGLMDTDGSVGAADGHVEYGSVSARLADAVVFLVRSLGGIARKTERSTWFTVDGARRKGAQFFRVSIMMPSETNPFMRSQKADVYARFAENRKYEPTRAIESIAPEGRERVVCLSVDAADSLYVTEDFIVTHNTTFAMFVLAYKLYRLSCLRDPASFYGLQARSKIAFGLYAFTKTQARQVGFYDLRDMILDPSPYFRDVFPRLPHGKETIRWPQKNIEVIIGSDVLHAIGRNLFAVVADELNYYAQGEKTAIRASELVAEVSRRLESRFVGSGGEIPGVAIYISQTRTTSDVLEQRIRDHRAKGTEGVHIVRGPRWAINTIGYDPAGRDPKRGFKEGDPTFRVYVGNEVSDPRLLDKVTRPGGGAAVVVDSIAEAPDAGGRILAVPVTHYRAFHDDIHGALRALADVPTGAFTPFFGRREVVEACFSAELPFPFSSQIIPCYEKGSLRLQDAFDHDAVTRVHLGRRTPVRHPEAPRYVALDLSQTGDRTGFAMVHPSGHYLDTRRGETKDAAQVGEGEVVKDIEVDFYLAITSGPYGEPIDYRQIRVFIDWLRRCGFPIRLVTCDHHMSFDMMQRLREAGFTTDSQSVDRTAQPYKDARQAASEGRVALPYPPGVSPKEWSTPAEALRRVLLWQEMTGLEHDVHRDKVDHRDRNPDGSKGSKDVADAWAAATFRCLVDKVAMGEHPSAMTQRKAMAARLNRYLNKVTF